MRRFPGAGRAGAPREQRIRRAVDAIGVCEHCGRNRTTTFSGAPVSCCPRAVRAPERANDVSSVVGAIAERLDRAVERVGSVRLAGPLTLAAIALVATSGLLVVAGLAFEVFVAAFAARPVE